MADPRSRPAGHVPLIMLVVLALGAAVGLYFGVGAGRQWSANRGFHPLVIPAQTAPASDAAAALAATTKGASPAPSAADAPAPTAAGVLAQLKGTLADPSLGSSVSAQVYDAATSGTLMNTGAAEVVAPASTAKLLTTAALLRVRKGTDRFTTRVLQGGDANTVVLVGGGDPTLSAAKVGQASEYPEAARISDLAAQVSKNLSGAAITSVVVDDSLFSGPSTATGWAPEDAPSSYASPIAAAMVDAGRDAPGATVRSAAPDLAAGRALADALGGAQVTRGTAPAGARLLGSVQSAPVSTLVEQTLSESDNVMAEVLARQVALATGQAGSFAGGAAAVSATLTAAGVAVGAGMKDGSGLSVADRIPAGVLGQTLLLAAGAKHPELRPVITGLAVAGWDGTLVEQGRFTGTSAIADGVVRAKTGSLTGVTGIAGVLTDSDGRQLVFAFVADKVPGGDPNSTSARTVLDSAVAALVRCGCR
ncbi:D-alanyl-D-alanine carboxypeptidase/D-alanyl-D-alanine-endopeptidase [Jatrophihabitans telluris]|uniref:D-alanyl-D-alanine carboxypeptidase/D-alanyl-D-alanine-endopeptidase n=1 Tax=Jatrophihabitans telluris TaxID=2038343 RepID=A0ABY4QZ91_9ACTN|nr:D-alanyl-D-alanine carboxypeptidase/D-alanyl-D-alanine-endopeptidase [Jatrophihabitans telluris]UQX88909.1 D-alanyl-D-alanine carboxypeptidase/D-alanyl-D-alanine-endopeptidase [Jatrophihabitans telluris]